MGELPCDVRQGGLRDAILHSASANAAHGLRRTNADKRRAVLMLLQDEEWGAWADREIARRCAVHHELVGRMRAEHLAETPDAPRTVERGGTVYPMKPRAGSPRSAEPAPSVPADLADALARQFRHEAELPRLPELVSRASQALAAATTAAEVLDARDVAALAYDAAKAAARFAKAKGAHDELVAAAHRAQADALEIEAQAKRRLADE